MSKAPVRVLLFALLRQAAGAATVELRDGADRTVEQCWEELCRTHPDLGKWRSSVRPALNQGYAEWSDQVHPGDKLAFLPPVSGGATSEVSAVRVGPAEIDLLALEEGLDLTGVGAIATFVGIVRDPDQGRPVPHLIYEAYSNMAELELAKIVAEVRAKEGVAEVRVHHRTGLVGSGAASVAVVVSAAHRHQALSACTYVIDELKSRAPIWKLEE
jgi:molybdopterin synthase catalytic subunit/molybdopterin converting factor small subunit